MKALTLTERRMLKTARTNLLDLVTRLPGQSPTSFLYNIGKLRRRGLVTADEPPQLTADGRQRSIEADDRGY